MTLRRPTISSNYTVTSGSFPTANIFLDEDLHSPLTREFTVSAAQEIGNGAVRAMYVWRKATGLVESFIDDADGGRQDDGRAERHHVRRLRQRLLPQLR